MFAYLLWVLAPAEGIGFGRNWRSTPSDVAVFGVRSWFWFSLAHPKTSGGALRTLRVLRKRDFGVDLTRGENQGTAKL